MRTRAYSLITPFSTPKPARAPQAYDERQRQAAAAAAPPPVAGPRQCDAYKVFVQPTGNMTGAFCNAVGATHKMVTLNTGTRKQARVGCAL